MLSGKEAKSFGSEQSLWKKLETLWWNFRTFDRFGREYCDLITRMYDPAYEQDPTFKGDLLAIGFEDIAHAIGNTDMRETVLTEVEMTHQLNRLRIRALRERA